MASITDICNLALLRIGQDEIQTLNEASNEARYCRVFYDRCRRSTLRVYPWNFATITAPLAQLTATSEEYSYVYQLPANCIRPLKILNGGADAPVKFEIKGKTLETDWVNPTLKYIFDQDDPAVFDDAFVETLAYRLASDIALPITGNDGLVKLMFSLFQAAIKSAQTSDFTEGTKQLDNVGQSFVSARG